METDENAMMASSKILELIDPVYNTPTPYFEYLINDLDALPFIANTRIMVGKVLTNLGNVNRLKWLKYGYASKTYFFN